MPAAYFDLGISKAGRIKEEERYVTNWNADKRWRLSGAKRGDARGCKGHLL